MSEWDQFDEFSTDDALQSLTALGVDVTSGFRTEDDVKRLKRAGYTPASSGGHMNGDGVDLVPGKSGMSLEQLADVARERFGPKAIIDIHNGSHVDVKVPGWGNAPDVYRADPWDAFESVGKAEPAKPKAEAKPKRPLIETRPAGEPYDGDTFPLETGDRGRLFGVDAFELNQVARTGEGETIPIGQEARDALSEYATPDGLASPTGDRTYGRPVVTLENGGDAGQAIISEGYGLAEPQYLKGDERFPTYMEAERLARLNRLGAHGNTYQKPEDFRHHKPEDQTAIFWDDPTPQQGLRPEIEQGYLAIWQNMNSKPEDLIAYAEANGFAISPEVTREAYARREKLGHGDPIISYEDAPRPLIDPGDDEFGSTMRGFGDPFNAIDELGGVVDTIGGTGGRENVWNSDRRFGDILWNNIDQNRAIIAHDEEEHPYYRMGGQLASAAVLPGVAAETLVGRAAVGAGEGFVQGMMGGEGDIVERLPDAALGTVIGAGGGAAVHGVVKAAPVVFRAGRKAMGREAPVNAVERDFTREAVGQPEALMRADSGPSVASEAISGEPDDVLNRRVGEMQARSEGSPAPADVLEQSPDTKLAANINLSKIETPDDIDALMRQTVESFDEFKPERRGVQTWEATEALAKDLGMTPDDLLARQTGQAFNAEQALGARNLLAASAQETRNLAVKAATGSEADKAAFVKSFFMHAAITEKAAGAAAEAGRALNIYRKVAKAGLGDTQAIQDAMKRLQDGASVDDIVEMVNSLADDPSALNRFARDAVKPRLQDKLMFVWINSLLSGPKTHVVNITSNLLTALMDAPEQAIASGLGAARRGNADRVLGSEIGPRLFGTIQGAADALQVAKKGWAEEAGGKLDVNRNPIKGLAGDIISVPTRLLNVEDEIFKAMARRSELAGMAVRKANAEGLKGADRSARIEQLLAAPTDDMMASAAETALYRTFQRPLGPAMQKVSNAINNVPVLKLFVPFIRTPTNLLKYAVERSPAAPLLKEVRNDFVAGGAKRDLAVARMMLGTGIGTYVASVVASNSGIITGGGPADPSAKKALEANGWQPYSIKVGDEYISYRRLDPWATIIGTAADAVELQSAMTDKQQQDAGAVLIGAVTQNLASKTWLSGLSDLIDAITNPQQNAKSTITRLASSMVTPTLGAQIAQGVDAVQRDTKDRFYLEEIRKKIMSRTPGLSESLIPRRDILGREVTNEGGALARLLSPFDQKADKKDAVAQAIYDSGARFDVPKREASGGRLTDKDYDAYQQVAGDKFRTAMTETMADPEWLTMTREEKRKAIEKIKNSSRKEARGELFGLER